MTVLDDTTSLIASPAVAVDRGEHQLVWPLGGFPAALDPASSTILQCFANPATVDEVVADLVEVLEVDEATIRPAATSVVQTLLTSGHLVPTGEAPLEPWRLAYPPSASP